MNSNTTLKGFVVLATSFIFASGQNIFPFRQILRVTQDSFVNETLDVLTTLRYVAIYLTFSENNTEENYIY